MFNVDSAMSGVPTPPAGAYALTLTLCIYYGYKGYRWGGALASSPMDCAASVCKRCESRWRPPRGAGEKLLIYENIHANGNVGR